MVIIMVKLAPNLGFKCEGLSGEVGRGGGWGG